MRAVIAYFMLFDLAIWQKMWVNMVKYACKSYLLIECSVFGPLATGYTLILKERGGKFAAAFLSMPKIPQLNSSRAVPPYRVNGVEKVELGKKAPKEGYPRGSTVNDMSEYIGQVDVKHAEWRISDLHFLRNNSEASCQMITAFNFGINFAMVPRPQ
jgi:hypothetical protein